MKKNSPKNSGGKGKPKSGGNRRIFEKGYQPPKGNGGNNNDNPPKGGNGNSGKK